jgi:hypothetical protein
MSPTELVAVLALVGYAVYRQTRVNLITGHSRFKLAIIYTAIGLVCGVDFGRGAAAYALLAVAVLASLGTGWVRGRLTRMWQTADGQVYSQGTPVTVGLFLGLIAFKFALGAVAYVAHIPYESGIGSILLMVGAMLAVQAELIARRAAAIRGANELITVGARS